MQTTKFISAITIIVGAIVISVHYRVVMALGLSSGPLQPKIVLETNAIYAISLFAIIAICAMLAEEKNRDMIYINFIPMIIPCFLLGIFLIGVIEECKYYPKDWLIRVILIDGISPIGLYIMVFLACHFVYLRKGKA